MGKYRRNRYHDVEIDLSKLKTDTEADLENSIFAETRKWDSQIRGRRGCDAAVMWIRIPKHLVHTLAWFLKHCFEMHHADKDHVMVVRSRSSRAVIPLYGTHYVRVECLVVEQGTGRILMVRERIGQGSSLKLVTGSVDLNEYISRAAEREVREEADVVAKVSGFIGCGNRLGTRFGRDEILVGVLMTAEPGQTPRGDGNEITEAVWIDPEKATPLCTPMAREWMIAGGYTPATHLQRGYLPDFRGPPHKMEVFLPHI